MTEDFNKEENENEAVSEQTTHKSIVPRKIEEEMKEAYGQYAMSVIVARALPDVRDGLKPVHRRILHAMNELGLDPNKAYKKSARIVGETMGKYHPHGDSSIYDAMVRMAQDFTMRYALVDGHGNFGSLDGDEPAHQRYTEAKLAKMAVEMLRDIEKDTVDFGPNYDGEEEEPLVLPARFPNLLVNGSNGIAVGMATYILPHNLTEIINGVIKIIDNYTNENRETDIYELLPIVKGPDFPTGASILGTSGIKSAFLTGRGKITVRADADIQPMGSGRDMIVLSSVPFQINKAKAFEKVGEYVKEKKIEGISDMRDESDRNGIRVVFELKKDANAQVVLNKIYKYSQYQESYSVNMLALVNGEPRTLNLLQMLNEYLKHQKTVVTRRTRFELEKAAARAHILQGLIIAVDNIDEVINIIRSSHDTPEAIERLCERFTLTKIQAEAIVDMQLRRLTGLAREKLQEEFNALTVEIARLEAILADELKLYGVIREELTEIKNKYGDERKTKIVPFEGEIDDEDLINEETSVITMTNLDYIKRLPLTTYKIQNRGGKGIIGMTTRDEDAVRCMFIAGTHDDILFFTTHGKVYKTRAYEIPEAGRQARGTAVVNLLRLNGGENIAAVIPVKVYERENDAYLMMVTKKGVVKKTPLELFRNIKKGGLIALTIKEGDELISVLETTGGDDIFVATKNGMGIRFNESGVRSMGRTSAGVRAIRLKGTETTADIDIAEADDDVNELEDDGETETIFETDEVIGAVILRDELKVLFVSEFGYGKLTERDMFRVQSRGGKGLKIYKITEKTGKLVGIENAGDKEELMLINDQGVIIRIRIGDVSTSGRVTQGVKLVNVGESRVVSIAKISEDDVETPEYALEELSEELPEEQEQERNEENGEE